MKTDLPLKRITRLCPQDVLMLAGITDLDVLGVETLELPASKTSLDTVIRLRSSDGSEYLHLIEWQGYADPFLLWRTMGYLAWLGQNRAERPILVTLIYLTPSDEVDAWIDQASSAIGGWRVAFSRVRLWEHNADSALARGQPGLMALAPLMRGATAAMVEQAVQFLLTQVEPPIQGELLAALGIFAEPIFETARFIRLVTKERLMSTDLISVLTADLIEEKAALAKELVVAREESLQRFQQLVEDVIEARFPSVPALTIRKLRDIRDLDRLDALNRAVLKARDLAEVEQHIEAARAG
jgi:hypothetical protein